jgi:hypothetical protein
MVKSYTETRHYFECSLAKLTLHDEYINLHIELKKSSSYKQDEIREFSLLLETLAAKIDELVKLDDERIRKENESNQSK